MRLLFVSVVFVAFVFLSTGAAAQISDSLYNALPSTAKPLHKTALTGNEKSNILLALDDFDAPHYETELKPMAAYLENEAATTKQDDVKIRDLNGLVVYYSYFESDSIIGCSRRLLLCATGNSKYSHDACNAYINIGGEYLNHKQFDSCIDMLHAALNISVKQNDSAASERAYTLYGVLYSGLHLYDSANYYQKQTILYFPAKDQWNVDYTAIMIGRAVDYNSLYKQNNQRQYVDSAYSLLYTIMQHKKNEPQYWYGACYFLLGYCDYEIENYAHAVAMLDSSLLPSYNTASMYYANNDVTRYLYKAACLIKLGRFSEAKNTLSYAQPRLQRATQNQMFYKTLNEYAEGVGDYKNALMYYKKYRLYTDTIDLEGQKGKLFEAQQKYSVKQKEADIAVLENKNLQAVAYRNKIAASAIIVVLVLAVVILLLYLHTKRQQLARLAERQKLGYELSMLERRMEDERLLQRQQEEQKMANQRKAISVDMHDAISSSLAAFCFLVKNMHSNAIQEETKIALSELEDEAGSIYAQTREFMHNLHKNDNVTTYDLVEFLGNLSITFGAGSSLQIETEYNDEQIEHVFTAQQHNETYLFVKEAVTNCMKHSGASLLSIKAFIEKNVFHIHLADNGRGVSSTTHGMGLDSMRKRIQALGGDVNFYINNGFNIDAQFPVG